MAMSVQAASIPAAGSRPLTTGREITRTRSKRASRNMIRTAVALIAAVFLLVGLSAYAASIQHANNVLSQENAYLQAEIDSLKSQLVEETKVTRVEEIATEEYGMVYPTSDNCIVIDESEESSSNLAAEIRSQAYN
jgi:cell division protein FtsL